MAVGDARLPRWFLSELATALSASTPLSASSVEGLHLLWVDAGNSFDAHGLSYAARAAGLDPKRVLPQVRVARPFNLFQLETMVCRKLPELWRGEPIVLSDPLALLHDDEVTLEEAARVFARVRAGIKALPALWLMLAVTRRAPKGRERWLDILIEDSDAHAFLPLPAEQGEGARRAGEGLRIFYGPHAADHHPDPPR